MKRINKLVILSLLLLIVLLGGCSYLRPEPEVKIKTKTEKIKVAVVNKDKVWTESKQAQQYQQQLQEKMKELEANTEQETAATQDEEVNHQQLVTEVNKMRQKLRNKFKQEIQAVTKKIMNEEGYDIVLDKTKVKYGGIDITDQVIKRIDNK